MRFRSKTILKPRVLVRKAVRFRHARIIAAGAYRRELAADLHLKECNKHREEGEDLSLSAFKTTQYRRRGNAVANDEQLARVAKVSKREFMRRGINQHTLEKICGKTTVRASKMAEVVKVLQQWESEQRNTQSGS
jgi:hypothetical protein